MKRLLSALFLVNLVMGVPSSSVGGPSGGGISAVRLLVPLQFDKGDYKVFVQDGRVRNYRPNFFSWGFDQYRPFCFFELRSPASTALEIVPGVFTVTSIQLDETEFVSLPARINVASRNDFGVNLVVNLQIMYLHSDKQPLLDHLACAAGFDLEPDVVFASDSQIAEALGSIAIIE